MYLKKVEFLGFKSFADRTVMNFLPGMTAIVGPNGCGKSNIADAVRWVLGEQSAKALRGGKMLDVIFSGAESIKPTNMAEVSLTLAECEQVLNTDYHEVTITRRLFRSGDSEYYLNKQPCRLRDIHRLFMDTGVGRNSYSILEQGKIDQVLSSRPEDRRLVFEEASGITKFKADRREALRKLEHTQQNLLRLDDVIREVKRRMISLQRQAGKARRYQEIQKQLRGRELWLTRHRLQEMQEGIGDREVRLYEVQQELDRLRGAVEKEETEITEFRETLAKADQVIAGHMEEAVSLRNRLHQAEEAVRVNGERIEEMRAYASRDSKDAEEAQARLEQHRANVDENAGKLQEARQELEEAASLLRAQQKKVEEAEQSTTSRRTELRELRNHLQSDEQTAQRAQAKLREFEQREQGRLVQQERLREGIAELEESEAAKAERVREGTEAVEALRERETALAERMEKGTAQQREHGEQVQSSRQVVGEKEKEVAGLRARMELLRAQEADGEQFPAGARALLSKQEIAGLDRSRLIGALARHIRTDKQSQKALESLLRSRLDALLVKDKQDLLPVLEALTGNRLGAARILAVEGLPEPEEPLDAPGQAFAERVRVSENLRPLVLRLFRGVRWVESFADCGFPAEGQILVNPEGHQLGGDGSLEIYDPDQEQANPLALQAKLTDTEQKLKAAEEALGDARARLEAAQGEEVSLQDRLRGLREEAQEVSRGLAGRESELRSAKLEMEQSAARLKQLRNQQETLRHTHQASDEERQRLVEELEAARAGLETLRASIEELNQSLESGEEARNQEMKAATDCRIRVAERRQTVEMIERQQQSLEERIRELDRTVRERQEGMNTYEHRVVALREAQQSAAAEIDPLKEKLQALNGVIEEAKTSRAEQQEQLRVREAALREQRAGIEAKTAESGRVDVDLAQRRVRLENLLQRVSEAYHVSLPELQEAEEPEWEGDTAPEWDELERTVESMKQKLESMGPVNMVAIEEYQEQEDRYQFLMVQQEDLVQAKQKLTESIQEINETTTEMFNKTFEEVNLHFQEMFKKLFGGGEARLELVDEQDVLESGIDIVARPPGKKPQVISLLSGGERTMTAVALLFALYSVKPSPFCILDELDAALDDANIGRFVALVQSFVKDSQFIVITHNQKTISAADVLYGITQERKGISKVVSVKLTDHDKVSAEPADGEPVLVT